jgi:hypothetical protein
MRHNVKTVVAVHHLEVDNTRDKLDYHGFSFGAKKREKLEIYPIIFLPPF